MSHTKISKLLEGTQTGRYIERAATHDDRSVMLIPPPHLEVYYASTCTPCRLELPAIAQAIAAGDAIRIVIVSDPERAKAELAAVDPALPRRARLADGRDPRDRLRSAGDPDGILPFARSVDARARTCATWRGMLTGSRIRALLDRCR